MLSKDADDIPEHLEELADDPDYNVRIQLLLSLSKSQSQKARTLSADILSKNSSNEMIAGAHKSLQKTDDIKKLGSKMGSLAEEDRTMITDGSAIFKSLCATCHGIDGKGVPTKLAPPLAGNFMRYVQNKDALIRILLHGLTGPVNGKAYSENMMAMGMNDDKWIASVLSYLRYDIGLSERVFPGTLNEGFIRYILVQPGEVKKIREESKGRIKPWTWEELELVKSEK